MRIVHLRLVLAIGALLVASASIPSADAARRSLRYGFPEDRIEGFAFEVVRTTTTTFEHLPAEAEPYDIPSLEARIGTVETRLEGKLERLLAKVFRDFSSGLVTRMTGVTGTVVRGGAEEALGVDILEGKSVSFRVLPSGELLDVAGWDRLSGAGRGGSLVEELLLQTVMRLPRDAPRKGDAFPANYRLRLAMDPFAKRDQTWMVAFTAGTVPADCRGCVAVDYEAQITEKTLDEHPARPVDGTGEAKVSGTILLARRTRALLRHDFTFAWDRTITSKRSNGTLRGRLRQTETVVGAIVAEEGS